MKQSEARQELCLAISCKSASSSRIEQQNRYRTIGYISGHICTGHHWWEQAVFQIGLGIPSSEKIWQANRFKTPEGVTNKFFVTELP